MKECWINVYDTGISFTYYSNPTYAATYAKYEDGKYLYRIHVRLK